MKLQKSVEAGGAKTLFQKWPPMHKWQMLIHKMVHALNENGWHWDGALVETVFFKSLILMDICAAQK